MGFALLAACEQSGVQFVVHVPADFGEEGDPQVQLPDEVRLFVGLGEEHAVKLAPEGFAQGAARSGTFWLRDPANLPDVDRAPISADAPVTHPTRSPARPYAFEKVRLTRTFSFRAASAIPPSSSPAPRYSA